MSDTADTTNTTGPAPARRPIAGPFAWRGAELAERDWIRPLPEGALDEIDAALGGVKTRGLAWRDITRADFPLPEFAATLAEGGRELEHGRGFVRRYRSEDDTIGEHVARMSTPVEVLVHDLFVHQDLKHAFAPDVGLYSQLPGGPMYPGSGRNQGELPLHERVIDLGQGTSGLMTLEVPQYKVMLQSVYDRLGWDADAFHGFRFKMRYPPIPSLAVLRYDLPESPQG